MIKKSLIIYSGAAACFIGCTSDFLSLYILGKNYPGYSHLSDTMSSLGSTGSPVSDTISFWWLILGLMMIIFAFGFRTAFSPGGRNVKIAFWLIILYGTGEGMGSGLFKADTVSGAYTISYIVHDILGGAGVVAILILPLIVKQIKPDFSARAFVAWSYITFILCTLFLILFTFRFLGFEGNIIAAYRGLWQRLFVLTSYFYMIIIALKMVARQSWRVTPTGQ